MTTQSATHLPTARYRSSDDDRTRAAVVRATLQELDDRGYAAASLRTIARRADLPLETVFTRWRSKQHLVFEAISELARAQPSPDTGSVRGDLLLVTEALVELLTHPGAAELLRSMLWSAGDGGGAAGVAVRIGMLGERRAAISRIIERGQRRQQFPATVHPSVAADAVVGAVLFRLLVSHEKLDRTTVGRIVDAIAPADDDS